MHWLRTVFNTLVYGTGAIVWLMISAVAVRPWIKTGAQVRKLVYWQSRGILFFMRLCAKSWRVEPAPRPQGPAVVAANHASSLDLYCVAALGFNNVMYITKGWVFRLPFFRFVMKRAGYIDAETTPPDEMLTRCRRAAEAGCDIVVFPQGSRRNPQGRFKSGAFYLAEKLNMPVIPVAIGGTGQMLAPGSVWLHPSDIVLKSLPPIRPDEFSGPLVHLEMARRTKSVIMQFLQGETL